VAEKPHDAVVKFDYTYRNLQRQRAVLPAIAWLSCLGFSVQKDWTLYDG